MPASAQPRLYSGTAADLALLARKLRAGELVAVPSETVYGLAANALNPRACKKIFAAKGRPSTDPLIVHIHTLAQLGELAEINPSALKLARAFWPGPLTLVLPKKTVVPAIVSAGLPSVAVRMPAHPLFQKLLKLSGLPLAAPSANPFGRISPTSAAHVVAGLGHKISSILDGGPSKVGLESTIIDLRDPAHPTLLRPGAITRAQLEKVLGVKVTTPARRTSAASENKAQLAPGLLKRHYSPRTPVELHKKIFVTQARASTPDEAWLFYRTPKTLRGKNIFSLSSAKNDPARAARTLFVQLHALDAAGFKKIHVELVPGSGLADAINDRLTRAAAKG